MPSDIVGAGTYGCTEWRRHVQKKKHTFMSFWLFLSHSVGVPHDRPNRTIIIQFLIKSYRNKIWKLPAENKNLKEKKLILEEGMTEADRMERIQWWPLVEAARKQGELPASACLLSFVKSLSVLRSSSQCLCKQHWQMKPKLVYYWRCNCFIFPQICQSIPKS